MARQAGMKIFAILDFRFAIEEERLNIVCLSTKSQICNRKSKISCVLSIPVNSSLRFKMYCPAVLAVDGAREASV
jgi:hypothetical protein